MRQPLLKPRFLLLLPFLAACAPAQDTFSGVQRIVAIGDIHGDYDRLVDLLRTTKLIDKQNAWAGGATHLVLDGDMVDRGPASRKVLDLVMALEAQAPSAGGAVHPLIGNHEAMDIIGDLRYVSKEDWESYRSPGSQKLLEAAAKSILDALTERGTPPPDAEAFLKDFLSQHPLGWVEQRLLFGPNGKYGKWLRQQNAIIRSEEPRRPMRRRSSKIFCPNTPWAGWSNVCCSAPTASTANGSGSRTPSSRSTTRSSCTPAFPRNTPTAQGTRSTAGFARSWTTPRSAPMG